MITKEIDEEIGDINKGYEIGTIYLNPDAYLEFESFIISKSIIGMFYRGAPVLKSESQIQRVFSTIKKIKN